MKECKARDGQVTFFEAFCFPMHRKEAGVTEGRFCFLGRFKRTSDKVPRSCSSGLMAQ